MLNCISDRVQVLLRSRPPLRAALPQQRHEGEEVRVRPEGRALVYRVRSRGSPALDPGRRRRTTPASARGGLVRPRASGYQAPGAQPDPGLPAALPFHTGPPRSPGAPAAQEVHPHRPVGVPAGFALPAAFTAARGGPGTPGRAPL